MSLLMSYNRRVCDRFRLTCKYFEDLAIQRYLWRESDMSANL